MKFVVKVGLMDVNFKTNLIISAMFALCSQTKYKRIFIERHPQSLRKANKNLIYDFERLYEKAKGPYYLSAILLGIKNLDSLGPFTIKFSKTDKNRLYPIIKKYTQMVSEDYERIQKIENRAVSELKKRKGRIIGLLKEAEKYTKIKFPKKIIIIPVHFLSGGMGFKKRDKAYALISTDKNYERGPFILFIVHEILHSIGPLVKQRSKLARQLNGGYKGIIRKSKREGKRYYGDIPTTIINESFIRSIERRLAVINGASEREQLSECKRFGITFDFYNALKDDYEKNPRKYKDIRQFGLYYLKKNFL